MKPRRPPRANVKQRMIIRECTHVSAWLLHGHWNSVSVESIAMLDWPRQHCSSEWLQFCFLFLSGPLMFGSFDTHVFRCSGRISRSAESFSSNAVPHPLSLYWR
ncbi:hypothetical protein TGRUB_237595 [Toxoplasma gondii RUB]|uniref:Uncharacterized protein n=1 Tax=Toxoplasma gondii RUB TaxID=935652 RepID=A0A086M098_TOXGO|nr:hypothetical protein TGRUB_237595 [Toxoplasma gondii RUB]